MGGMVGCGKVSVILSRVDGMMAAGLRGRKTVGVSCPKDGALTVVVKSSEN